MTKKLPRVAAVHDISGYGKCSLTVAIPLLSAAGIEVCPLVTATLSTNTLFPGFTFYDMTEHMRTCIAHWRALGLKFESVYSGFLGSAEQIGLVMDLIQNFESGVAVVDPVMGDHGKVISTYTKEMCDKMADLVAVADVVTPNITEACLLAGRPYAGPSLAKDEAESLCRSVKGRGAKNVVLTGVVRGEKLYNCVLQESGKYFESEIGRLDFSMHGTGDLFTSTLTAALVRGYTLADAVASAALFVRDAMVYSLEVENVNERGVAFEPLVYELNSGVYLG
ncbi:MAG: pyridoxamine kinase [Clostridiales bacterium]|nr:pyridoxamine kinase [Clostridiales bacterium]